MLNRRRLLQGLVAPAAALLARTATAQTDPGLANVSHAATAWKTVGKGLEFSRINVSRNNEIIDVLATLRVDPKQNQIRVFSSYEEGKTVVRNIEEWQKQTGAVAMVNSAQYMAQPYYMPCALIICDGKVKGPKSNNSVRGMFVAEPLRAGLAKADLLDFEYERYEPGTYSQGVQHWPILLDRNGKVKVKKTNLQANRTIVAKDLQGRILFITTERSFFTLYNLGQFLKESNARKDRGLQIHTAMNLDGGTEANMVLKTKDFSYVRYGPMDPEKTGNFSLFNFKVKIPGVIGIFPR